MRWLLTDYLFDLRRRPKLTVFLSSTYVDLYDERECVERELDRRGFEVVNRLRDVPRNLAHPDRWSVFHVERADIFIQMLGGRRGSLPYGGPTPLYWRPTVVSELRAAQHSCKPVLIYSLHVPFTDHVPSDTARALREAHGIEAEDVFGGPITKLAACGVGDIHTISTFAGLRGIGSDVERLARTAWLRRLRFWEYDAVLRRHRAYGVDFEATLTDEPTDPGGIAAALNAIRSWPDGNQGKEDLKHRMADDL